VEEAVSVLRRTPDIGSPRKFKNPQLAGLRNWPIPGFAAIRIYYIHSGENLRIVRVLHGKSATFIRWKKTIVSQIAPVVRISVSPPSNTGG